MDISGTFICDPHGNFVHVSDNWITRLQDRININQDLDETKCFTCGKAWKHYKRYFPPADGKPKEVEFIVSHAGCRSLERKIREKKEELLNLEYELFCKKC